MPPSAPADMPSVSAMIAWTRPAGEAACLSHMEMASVWYIAASCGWTWTPLKTNAVKIDEERDTDHAVAQGSSSGAPKMPRWICLEMGIAIGRPPKELSGRPLRASAGIASSCPAAAPILMMLWMGLMPAMKLCTCRRQGSFRLAPQLHYSASTLLRNNVSWTLRGAAENVPQQVLLATYRLALLLKRATLDTMHGFTNILWTCALLSCASEIAALGC